MQLEDSLPSCYRNDWTTIIKKNCDLYDLLLETFKEFWPTGFAILYVDVKSEKIPVAFEFSFAYKITKAMSEAFSNKAEELFINNLGINISRGDSVDTQRVARIRPYTYKDALDLKKLLKLYGVKD